MTLVCNDAKLPMAIVCNHAKLDMAVVCNDTRLHNDYNPKPRSTTYGYIP